MTRQSIFLAINLERVYQNQKHPRFTQPLAVLMEEVGECATAIQNGDQDNLREELIQVASVAVRWLEQLEGEAK